MSFQICLPFLNEMVYKLQLRRNLWLYVAFRNNYENDLFNPYFWAIKYKQVITRLHSLTMMKFLDL